jgi:predicted Holliday junction resolvase-like endonuclease
VFTPVLAKHTKSFNLIDTLAVGVDRIQRNFEPLQRQVELWRKTQVTDERAKLIFYNAFIDGALVIIIWLLFRLWNLRAELGRISGQIREEAMAQFRAWREKDYDTLNREQAEIATREAQVQLAQWMSGSESTIRADAIQQSQSVIIGKVTEHVVPYLPEFTYNPKDARFIGSPVDLIVFDGLDWESVEQIVFIEVKSTATAALTKRERLIRDAIQAGRVQWREIRLDPSRSAKTDYRLSRNRFDSRSARQG